MQSGDDEGPVVVDWGRQALLVPPWLEDTSWMVINYISPPDMFNASLPF